jgi:hypothetical protein
MSSELAVITQALLRLSPTRPPISIVNAGSANAVSTGLNITGSKQILSGALSANVLVTALSLVGPGTIDYLACCSVDTTARNIRMKITRDGIVVLDGTATGVNVAGSGVLGVGCGSAPLPTAFDTSLFVEISSSITETDKIALRTIYRLT